MLFPTGMSFCISFAAGLVLSLFRQLCFLLQKPRLSSLLSGDLDIGGVDAAIGRWTDAPGTDTEHETVVDDIAIETGIVVLQALCGDTVRVGDAFACVLVSALVNKLTVISVASKTELGANFEGVAISASIEEIERKDLVGGREGLLSDLVTSVTRLDSVVTRAGGVIRVESGSRYRR